MSADDQLREANWKRMRDALTQAATEYRRSADELEQIQFDDHKGRRRAPEAIISQAALTMHTAAGATLIHRLATWAETLNELDQHAVHGMVLCGYKVNGEWTATCVLAEGHALPFVADQLFHVNQRGETFR